MEHNLTLAYMELYGYKKVRGGFISKPDPLIKIGNRMYLEEEYHNMTVVLFLLLVILYLGLYIYINKIH